MAAAWLCFMTIAVGGQTSSTDGTTPLGLSPGDPTGSYSLSGLDSVNLYNGNLNFGLPLLKIGGRGGASAAMILAMDTKSWHVEKNYDRMHEEERFMPRTRQGGNYLNPGEMKGRQVSVQRDNYGGCYADAYGNPLPWPRYALTRLTFTSPDGTEHEFRDLQTNGQPLPRVSCYVGASRGTVFVTADGSDMTFISDSTIVDRVGLGAYDLYLFGYLLFHDGTRYRIDNNKVSWIRDRNGNVVSFTYNATLNGYPNGRVIAITDSLNRQVTISYGDQSTTDYYDEIHFLGSGGTVRTIRVNHTSLSNVLRSGFTVQDLHILFPELNGPEWLYYLNGPNPYNPTVVSSVILPNGKQYQFSYNSYGELARVVLPTAGAVEYDMVPGSGVIGDLVDNAEIYRRVAERRVYADGGSGSGYSEKTTFTATYDNIDPRFQTQTTVTTDHYDSGGNQLIAREKHYFTGSGQASIVGPAGVLMDSTAALYPAWTEGFEYKTEAIDPSGAETTVLRRSEPTQTQTSPSWWTGTADAAPANNPHITQSLITLADVTPNLVTKQEFAYDSFGNKTDVYEYDFGSGAPGALLRRSHTDYVTDTNYTAYTGAHLRGLPSQTWVSSDSAGSSKKSLTTYEFDNYATDSRHAALVFRSSVVGFDSTNYSTSNTVRGNLTGVTSYGDVAAQTGAITVSSQYDILGNVIKTVDANGNASTISYNDDFGSPDSEARTNSAPAQLNGQQTFAFPTSATNAIGYTAYTQVDYFTGAVVDVEDVNGNISTTFYNDVLDRPTQSIAANNRPNFRRQSSIVYDDVNRIVTVTADSKTFNDNLLESQSFYDKMGRTIESRQYEDATNYIAVQHQYDSLGRAYKASNPFKPNLGEQPQWTTTSFDALGRVTQIQTPDNAIVSRSYSGTTTTVTDQALRKRSGTTDAIGRLLRVNEDPTGLNYQTDYTYDVLGRLRKTSQTSGATTQNRYFMYNDLGRLIRAKQTEQGVNSSLNTTDPVTGNSGWSVSYGYDNNGNITSTTDASNRTITGTYDTINRLTFRDYSDNTPDVTFTHDDPLIANSKGQLTAITTSVSSMKYTAFDELGRIKSSQQITNGLTYNFPDYTYDLSGALVSQTYPSGRIVTTTTDNVGRLSAVAAQVPNQAARIYINNFTYNSVGAITSDRLGNGVWESAQFDNNRAQVKQIGLGTSAGDTSLLKLEYDYGTTDNNGSLRQQKITVPGIANQLVQNYTYDNLNRLAAATETANSAVQWKQTFLYDRFGNRRFDAANTTTLIANDGVYNPQIDSATNRFTVAEGYNYDSEGNLTSNPESQLFSYDAENHLTQVQNTSSQTTATYQYDGTGKRVRKLVGDQETVFVYDAFGKLVAEYTMNQAVTTEGTKYLSADALGSPRAITNNGGSVVSRHDYMPFGEEVYAGIGGRASTQGYLSTGDGVRQQFTGYERDEESGLDYAQARYYSGRHGRFTSVDPLTASMKTRNPQSFNRYAYVDNNPLGFTDPGGMCKVDGAKEDDGKPCPDFKGQVYQDKNGGFANFKCDGCSPYTGPAVSGMIGGVGVQITSGGWTQLGPAASEVTVEAGYGALEDSIITAGEDIIATEIAPHPLIPFIPLVGTAVGAAAITLTAVPPGGSPCQVATGDDFCGHNPANETSPQTDIQPDTGHGPATTEGPPDDGPLNRGRIQVQGSGVETSSKWAQRTPPTKAQGQAALTALWNSLSRSQQRERNQAYIRAQNFINSCPAGGCVAPLYRSYSNRNARNPNSRIDIEIRTGRAFVN